MVANFTYRSGRTSAGGARGSAFVLLAHLRRTTIVIGFALVTATGKRRADVSLQTGAHWYVVDYLALGVLAAGTGVTLFFCKVYILNTTFFTRYVHS